VYVPPPMPRSPGAPWCGSGARDHPSGTCRANLPGHQPQRSCPLCPPERAECRWSVAAPRSQDGFVDIGIALALLSEAERRAQCQWRCSWYSSPMRSVSSVRSEGYSSRSPTGEEASATITLGSTLAMPPMIFGASGGGMDQHQWCICTRFLSGRRNSSDSPEMHSIDV
jgi:hypothetical protein